MRTALQSSARKRFEWDIISIIEKLARPLALLELHFARKSFIGSRVLRKATKITAIAVSVVWFPGVALAGLSFDKLTACADIATTLSSLQLRRPTDRANCVQPHGPLETALQTRSSGNLCFLGGVPAPFVAGFDCFYRFTDQFRELTCFKAWDDIDVSEYHADYGANYSKRVTGYLAAAHNCSANQFAMAGPLSERPSSLMPITRYEFGYLLPLGSGLTTNSFILHGVATPDPSLGLEAHTSIEFVYVLVAPNAASPNAALPQPSNGQVVGNWKQSVETELFPVLPPGLQSALQNAHVRALASIVLGFERAEQAPPDTRDRRAVLEHWQQTLAAVINHSGYEDISSDDALGNLFATIRASSRESIAAIPFGDRDFVSLELADRIYASINTHDLPCGHHGGLLMATVTATAPASSVIRNYGRVHVDILGAGACADENAVSREYLENLSRQVTGQTTLMLGSD
jgi:hypothetical protein